MGEEELAEMRIDAGDADMTIDESANLGWVEDGVLCDGY